MRRRLLVLLLGLMAVVLVVLGVPLAIGQARAAAQEVFLDRLGDANRFAASAQQSWRQGEVGALRPQLRRYDEVYGDPVAVLDRDGAVSAASDDAFVLPDTSSGWLSTALSGRGTEPPAAVWPWSSDALVVAQPVIDAGDVVGVVVVVSSTATIRHRLLVQWSVLAAGEVAAMAVCVLLALMLTRWILRPVAAVDAAAHAIAEGQLTARVPVREGPPELRRLSVSLNSMADTVEEVLESQQSFVADASHQLRNLLNALLLQLQDLAMHLPMRWRADAEHALAEGRRLAATLEQLLTLATAGEATDGRPERVDLAALLRERLDVWRIPADARGIVVQQSGTSPLRTAVDRVAVVNAVDVVMDNAVKFSDDDSRIQVTLSHGSDRTEIEVLDWGPGLPPDEIPRAGQRFWRSRRDQNVPGSGLGLAIARAMLQPSGGTLTIARAPGAGLRVTIAIPTRPPAVGAPSNPV